ncbi:Gldg family protein [Robertkochia solimangrovi]|uniref:Gldg family protein n=1 Tax=Robertkochia solimangrovi TaxID=2213046 RepID=UPI00117F6A88|nr:Gldg family protein [Robertkochia solimangrovi]TRZ45189.1 ABC transporter [Robertkochia solimangrovi]
MKKIIEITKLELSVLFYSPIAWILLILFALQSGLSFTDLLEAKANSQQLGNDLKDLTYSIFGGDRGFLSTVKNRLYLFIPLLTMGTFSKEMSSGTIKLLFSSPVSNFQIVLGKYVAFMIYGIFLCVALLMVMGTGVLSIENFDVRYVLGGILGLYLLICTYAAIGIFMSSLTTYQVVAAISTLGLLAALHYIGEVGQSIDIIRNITYWLSISGRVDNFINGLIGSRDVIYFIAVILFFLMLTVFQLEKAKNKIPFKHAAIRITKLLVCLTAVGFLSTVSFLDLYLDTTRFDKMTLTKQTKNLLHQIDKPVTLTTYVNIINNYAHLGSPKWRIFDRKQFDQYRRFLPDMEMNYVAYYDSTFTDRDTKYKSLEELAQRSATAYGFDFESVLRPEEIRKIADLTEENNLFVRKLEYDGKSTSLRMFYDMLAYPGEAEISAAFKRLLTKPAIVGVLDISGERNIARIGDKGYKNFIKEFTRRSSRINQGFDFQIIDGDNLDQINDSLSFLLIADPMEHYSEDVLSILKKYIQEGGNLLLNAEPGKTDYLNPLVSTLGMKLREGKLLSATGDLEEDLIIAKVDTTSVRFDFDAASSRGIVSLSGAIFVEESDSSDFMKTPLLYTDQNVVNTVVSDSILGDQSEKTVHNSPLGWLLERKKENKTQKIAIVGDADYLSNGELGRYNLRTKNFEFASALFSWFSNGEYAIEIYRPEPIDNEITADQAGLNWVTIFLTMIIPGLLLVTAVYLLIARKQK